MKNSIQLPLGKEMEERSAKVFSAANKFMESWLQCPDKKTHCFECGNAECFEALEDMAEVYGMTFAEFTESMGRQRVEAKKAVELQNRGMRATGTLNLRKLKRRPWNLKMQNNLRMDFLILIKLLEFSY